MTLRSDIHAALEAVTPAAPHLPVTAVDAAVRGDAPARRDRRGQLLLVAAAVLLVFLIGGVVTLRAVTVPAAPAAAPPPAEPPANLVVTTWVPDPSVTVGPYPGFRPEVRMDQRAVASAHAVLDPGGRGWVVAVTFTPEGRRAFTSLSTSAFHACPPGTCPESYVTMWRDLTPDDVAHWNQRADLLYADKLLSDPYIESPITGDEAFVAVDLSQHDAETVAGELNHSGSKP